MLLRAIDKKIRKSFSDAAYEYDLLSSLHKEIGRELSRKVIDNEQVDSILDIGMGTGWLTNRLAFYLPESTIIGLDFAPNMLKVAKDKWQDINVMQGNAIRLPFKSDQFDIVVSNLAYQWVSDLEQAFQEDYRVLKDEGNILITLFGYNTFQELFDSLEKTQHHHSDEVLGITRLNSLEQIKTAAMKAGFKDVTCDYEMIKVHFSDMYSLIKWIKQIGANVLPKDTFIGKQWLKRANTYYSEHHKDRFSIYATFEVVWLQGKKTC